MFDERSNKWLSILKGLIISLFWGYIIAGVILGLVFIGEKGFGGFLLFAAGGVAAAFLTLPLNMLALQYLSNVQIIRQRLENGETNAAHETKHTAPASASAPTSKNNAKVDSLRKLLAQGLITQAEFEEKMRNL